MPGKEGGVLISQHLLDLQRRPHVEFALLTPRVRIEGGAERPSLRRHFAREPIHGFTCARAKQRIARMRLSKREQLEQLCGGVKHLLEMRDGPAVIYLV